MPKEKIFSLAGGSVQANEGLYISRGADEELLELCRAGAFCYVLTPRQMGKSSLMVRTAERLADEGVTPIIIDLQAIGVELTAEQWYYGLVSEIDEKVSLRTKVKQWWKEHDDLGFGQRLTLFFRDVLLAEAAPDERIVIFVDEIDTTLSLGFTDDFYTAVRSIYGSRANDPQFRRLSFVLIGVATPTDLIRDPKRTPFNIGQRVDLTDFTFEEALPLARGLGLPEPESREVLRWVLGWTGGHPFLTQQLCAAIAAKGKASWTREDVDAVVAEKFFGEDFGKNSNLMFVRDMLTKRAPDRETVLNTYAEVLRGERPVSDEGQSVPKAHLKLSGVVCAVDGVLSVRNRIYREVFNERWVKKHNPPNLTKRLVRVAGALVVAVLLLMFLMLPFSLYQWRQAKAALDEAVIQREEAVAARKDAEQQRLIAESRRIDADEQRTNAEKARAEAEKSAGLEKNAKGLAEARRVEAEKQRSEAEKQRDIARVALAEAETQRRRAEEQQKRAEQAAAEADELRKKAVEEKQISEQSQLVSQMLTAQNDDRQLQQSVLLAREVLRSDKFRNYSIEAYAALSRGLSLLPRPLKKYAGQFSDVGLSADGKYLLSGLRNDGRYRLTPDNPVAPSRPAMDLTNALVVHEAGDKESFRKSFGALNLIEFSPDMKYLVTADIPARPLRRYGNTNAYVNVNVNVSNANVGANINGNYNSNYNYNGNYNSNYNGNSASSNVNRPYNYNGNYNGSNFNRNFNEFNPNYRSSVGTIWGWDGGQLSQGRSIVLGRGVSAVALSPGGKYVAVARLRFPSAGAAGAAKYKPAGYFLGPQRPPAENGPEISLIDVANSAQEVPLRAPGRLTNSSVSALTFSATGRLVAAAQADGRWVVWRLVEGQEPIPLTGARHGTSITAIAISPDERYVATAGDDAVVRVWRVQAPGSTPIEPEFKKMSFAPYLAYAQEEEADKDGAPEVASIRGHRGQINAVVFSPKGDYIATASDDDTARVWAGWGEYYDVVVEVARMTHDNDVTGVSFAGDGRTVATASMDGTARVWEMSTAPGTMGESIFGAIDGAAWSPNERVVSVSGPEGTTVWDLAQGKELFRLSNPSAPGATPPAWAVREGLFVYAVNDDGRYLLMADPSRSSGSDEERQSPHLPLSMWDTVEKRAIWSREIPGLRSNPSPFDSWIFDPAGKYICLYVTENGSGVAKVLNARTGQDIMSLNLGKQQRDKPVGFTPDGEHLAVAVAPGRIRLVELKDGRVFREWEAGQGASISIEDTGLSRNKGVGYLATAGGDSVRVWEALSGRLVREVKAPGGLITVKFSPDGEHFAVGYDEGISIWSIEGTSAPVSVMRGDDMGTHQWLSFDATGQYIASADRNTAIIWKTLAGCEVARLPARMGIPLMGHDGKHVMLLSEAGVTWSKWRPADLIDEVCGYVTRNLSMTEWRNQYRLKTELPKTCASLEQNTRADDERAGCPLEELLR